MSPPSAGRRESRCHRRPPRLVHRAVRRGLQFGHRRPLTPASSSLIFVISGHAVVATAVSQKVWSQQ